MINRVQPARMSPGALDRTVPVEVDLGASGGGPRPGRPEETTLRSGNLQARADAHIVSSHALVRMGRFADALPRCQEAMVRFEIAA